MVTRGEELQSKRIGVLYGGLSAEREVSLETGAAVLAALLRRGYGAVGIDVGRDICQRLAAEGVQVAFIALHGLFGEDGCMQGLLESLGIPYTGSGVQASAMAMDKVVTKRLMDAAGLPTPAWRYPVDEAVVMDLGLPAVVKPRREGSSVGLTIVREAGQLPQALALAGDAMAERYVPGRELTVGVLGRAGGASVMGSVEIRPRTGHYDYEAKYKSDETRYLAPAPVPDHVARRMAETALALHRMLECDGGTRTDFRWDEQGEPLALEINTIPGMTGHSLLPMMAGQRGMDYDDLAEALLRMASLKVMERPR